MWAEITLRCKRDLPADLASALQSRFHNQADLHTAISRTFLKDNDAISDIVIYPQISSSRILLVFKPESRTLRMHVEAILRKESLRVLKRETEGVIEEMESFVRLHHNKTREIQIVIGGNDDDIMTGMKSSLATRIKRLVLDDVVIKLIVPAVTYVVSALTNQDASKALTNAIVAFCALMLFTIGKSFTLPKFEYKEV